MTRDPADSASRAPSPDEASLIARAQQGDQAAFETLYARHLDAIYRYIYFRVGDEIEAEDLCEETFVRAWETLPSYRIGAARFASWLYRIAHNLTVDQRRKRRPLSLVDPQLDRMAAGERTEDIAENKQTLRELSAAIQRLDDVEQMVIIMRFVEGVSHQETAAAIGKSVEASRAIQHRALEKLSAHLADQEAGLHG